MQETGFQTWGFVIYRGTYSDNAAWQRFVDEMKEQVRDDLDSQDREELLSQYLKYTIIEDPSLEGASKDTIRKRFREWVANRSVERDGAGVDHPFTNGYPIARFTHCLYVDQKCLDTLTVYEAWRDAGKKGLPPLVACAIIDIDCKARGEGGGGFPEIEGCTRYYPGWMYLGLYCIPEIYNMLSIQGLADGGSYARPPLIYPGHASGTSVPT